MSEMENILHNLALWKQIYKASKLVFYTHQVKENNLIHIVYGSLSLSYKQIVDVAIMIFHKGELVIRFNFTLNSNRNSDTNHNQQNKRKVKFNLSWTLHYRNT